MALPQEKIAILTPTFHHYSGIDRVVEEQAKQFAKEGKKVTVFALESSIEPKGYDVVVLGMPKGILAQRLYRLFFFLNRTGLNKYRMLQGYGKVIAHFYPMTWLGYEAKKYFGTRYVYWDHGINTTGLLDSAIQKLYMRIFRFFNNYTIRTADEAYSVSQYLSDQLKMESHLISTVVYNPIDTKRFNAKVRGDTIRKKYGIANDPLVLYVGRLSPHKGIHMLISAFEKARVNMPNAKLLIVGKVTYPDYFKRLKARASESVIFAGVVDDKSLPLHYAACDVYATCSQWEGFNLPAAEAQECGKPVVAFDVGSHPEIVKNGSLIKNKDLKDFSDALVFWMQSKKKPEGKSIVSKARKKKKK